MLDKGQLNGFDVAAGSVPDGHRKEQFSSYSASSRITENASLPVQKTIDVAGSFGICNKELPEQPACGTFLSLFFIFRAHFIQTKACILGVSTEQLPVFGQTGLFQEKKKKKAANKVGMLAECGASTSLCAPSRGQQQCCVKGLPAWGCLPGATGTLALLRARCRKGPCHTPPRWRGHWHVPSGSFISGVYRSAVLQISAIAMAGRWVAE